jgi:hypothetical protein
VEIPWTAASGADRKLSRQVRLRTGRESRNLLVPHMHPFYLALAADRIGQPVQTVADDAIYPLHAGGSEGFHELISDCFSHSDSPSLRPSQ